MDWIRTLMPGKQTKATDSEARSGSEDEPRYPKPRVMLIDLDEEVATCLKDLGYNVVIGSFGHPYEVEPRDRLVSVSGDHALSGFEEQEIVVIDLLQPESVPGGRGDSLVVKGKAELWTSALPGQVDPRPATMAFTRDAFDRILAHGGCFVVFAASRAEVAYILEKKDLHRRSHETEKLTFDNWSFLSTLSPQHIQVTRAYGTEIAVPAKDPPLAAALDRHLEGSSYLCTLEREYFLGENQWVQLAVNKYDETVAAAVIAADGKGFALILPQIAEKAGLIGELLQEDIPDLSPHLFPHVEGAGWIERPEYELATLLQLKDEKETVKAQTDRRLAELDKRIAQERAELGFLHDILTTSGDDLVEAVRRCLEFIGFRQVVDVDQLMAEVGDEGPRQEDLRILDQSPSLLLEVKGLAGLPRESDALQVVKYLTRRMKEWNRTDVQGLSLVNHQRNLPGLDREYENVFTQQQVQDAQLNAFGLLTTWEFFLLIRGMIKHEWDPVHLRSPFYGTGRIGRLPGHYQPVGKVFHYWDEIGVVGVELLQRPLKRGDRVGFVLRAGFEEQLVESLEVDHKPVEIAEPGQKAGLKTSFGRGLLREGTMMCLVAESESVEYAVNEREGGCRGQDKEP